MLGFGALGQYALGEVPGAARVLAGAAENATVTLSTLIRPDSNLLVPEKKVAEGLLIQCATGLWLEIAKHLGNDWSLAMQLTPTQWEEMIAGAFKRDGFDDVVLTPRSGDQGRDVIATRNGIGCVKILSSVKAYRPGHLVTHDDVRALLGVLAAEPDASKGIVATTSEFAPLIETSPQIKQYMPTRLELLNGTKLQGWLKDLTKKHE
jgi:restriction system protein